ncbi:MAG: hypothetical protein A2660_03055 [Candidatus Doudnabacteria bacterium RIFCSPHIGHO2_01_FULL_45_18]|uniref:Uncharacterized protein n=1 Tax=Candidatus Doudnabacteria bacterium RIFCSPHIGHO2_01_FULL_45_18 TaxID=1817823 RepID=A0A1F5NPV2_9BACT|nr:MAG: hypothetical protein A2660_03055 [Candidatus Doudnabacteria bacterium RIFCSPHIGHO2_01_FULL_45_18]
MSNQNLQGRISEESAHLNCFLFGESISALQGTEPVAIVGANPRINGFLVRVSNGKRVWYPTAEIAVDEDSRSLLEAAMEKAKDVIGSES